MSRLDDFRKALLAACQKRYGERLVSLAIFGSWARNAATPVSDIDVLLVAKGLPPSRRKRVLEFESAEADTAQTRRRTWKEYGTTPELSPVIKSPEEVESGSPLFLDMTAHCDILFDREGFLGSYLSRLRARMRELNSRRLPRKGGYYWQYKPDIRPKEVVSL